MSVRRTLFTGVLFGLGLTLVPLLGCSSGNSGSPEVSETGGTKTSTGEGTGVGGRSTSGGAKGTGTTSSFGTSTTGGATGSGGTTNETGTGGATSSGGTTNQVGTGGASTTGGTTNSGGTSTTGDATGSGGTTNETGTGGTTSTGGTTNEAGTGGTTSSGGTSTTGGVSTTGGATGSGGTTNQAGTGGTSAEMRREMERLDRGVVAILSTSGIYIGWRLFGTDPTDISFDVYRGTTKLNSTPITDSTNYLDPDGTTLDSYTVVPSIGGVKQAATAEVKPWDAFYHAIPLTARTGYFPNDATVGDLDGDGAYEIVVKRLATELSATTTQFNLIEAYELDGTPLWTIDLGPNNLYADMEINPIVYDFDGDGRAELALRTSEGNIDGKGNQIGDVDGDGKTDYRSSAVLNSSMWMIEGPEFLSIFDGKTGAELTRTNYIDRAPLTQWGDPGMTTSQLAHRADKCMMTPAYLDGRTPSLVISRGIYHKIVLEAWSFRNGTLSKQWTFNSDDFPGYASQGNHNLTVGDVDSDGKDEIVYGQMAVDDNGKGLYTTGLGHGDAIHMSKMIPDRAGLQVLGIHEQAPYGATLRDAATGEIIWRHTATGDTGRGCAAHIDSNYPGYQMWSVSSGGTYDATTKTLISANQVNWGNFLIWWDADLQREILDGVGSTTPSPIISKWDSATKASTRLLSLYNYPTKYATKCINGTKSNPALSGDILGDWREEAIYPAVDGTALYIYTTTALATNRIYTLMHDSQYRTAIAWQCNMYNQPPHPSFYIGAGMSAPPTPKIVLTGP